MERCSQKFVDLLDLEERSFRTMPIHDILDADYPSLRYIAQISDEGYFSSLRSRLMEKDKGKLVLTFEDLLRRTPFAERMRQFLHILEYSYEHPVDLEFTLNIKVDNKGNPDLHFTFLQCRPQSRLAKGEETHIPGHLPKRDVILKTHFMVPQGAINNISHVLFVPPAEYFKLQMNERFELARVIGKVNKALKNKISIFVGPGRWGTTNTDLGIPIGYSDIYNTRALIELSGKDIGATPEPSLGTHFFQDLLESQIYPLAIILDDPQSVFQTAFFYHSPNALSDLIPADDILKTRLRVIEVNKYRKNHTLRLVMNEEHNTAIGYLIANQSKIN